MNYTLHTPAARCGVFILIEIDRRRAARISRKLRDERRTETGFKGSEQGTTTGWRPMAGESGRQRGGGGEANAAV